MKFHVVDVFAEHRYEGNQLAVVLDAGSLDTDRMQTIALEMKYAETTFVLSREMRAGGHDVRIFTPATEVPFAGHPTLGTAWVLRAEGAAVPESKITLNLGVGPIEVTFEPDDAGEVLWMHQNAPEFGRTLPHERAAELLGLDRADVDARYPVQEVSTGLPFLLVPLTGMEAVKRARLDRPSYERLGRETGQQAIFLFSAETYDAANQINARMFADELGVVEDPATGSANGCLASYLARYRYFGSAEVQARVEQGYEIRRPSILRLRSRDEGERVDVHVGGRVQPSMTGQLL